MRSNLFKTIIKKKKRNYYFIITVVVFVLLSLNLYSKIDRLINIKEFSHEKTIEEQINKFKQENIQLKRANNRKEKEIKRLFKYYIYPDKLKTELKTLCSSLVDAKTLKRCKVFKVTSPYKMLNVAYVQIEVENNIDAIVLKRIMNTLYNTITVNYDKNDNLLKIELFKRLKNDK